VRGQDGGITQTLSRPAQDPPTQNPQSQSPSLEHFLTLHPPVVAVVVQTELIGQPVWLHGWSSQPCGSVPALPAAH
jgi:hypothetical protein